MAQGVDPMTIPVGEKGGTNHHNRETSICTSFIHFVVVYRFFPIGCSLRFWLDIATNYGGDCTKWGIDTQFRKIKTDAMLIRRAVAKGVDPITVPVGENGRSVKGVGWFLLTLPFLSYPKHLPSLTSCRHGKVHGQ